MDVPDPEHKEFLSNNRTIILHLFIHSKMNFLPKIFWVSDGVNITFIIFVDIIVFYLYSTLYKFMAVD